MAEWILYGKCETCKRNALFVRKRKIQLPAVGEAKSQKLMCGKCFSKITSVLKQRQNERDLNRV